MIAKESFPHHLLMIDLPFSFDDEFIECAYTDIVMPFPEFFPLGLSQALSSPHPANHEIELIPNFKLFSRFSRQPWRHETEQMQVIVEKLHSQGFIRHSTFFGMLQ
jgi:hypothetical protein